MRCCSRFDRSSLTFRHSGLRGELAEVFLVAANHQADDAVGALLVEAMFVVEDGRDLLFLVAPIAEKPAPSRLH